MTALSQSKKFKIHTVAFYNLENLFDTINAPDVFDEYSPIMALKTNKTQAYEKKIKRMAYAISKIGTKLTAQIPSVIGVCEIENRTVLEDLINTSPLNQNNYGIVHYDSPDARGIDVALLYKKDIFIPQHSTTHTLKLYDPSTQKRIKTRDQLVVSGALDGELLYIIINHWPSRRGGEAKSRLKRINAAKLNKQIIDSLQLDAPYAKIITMGDFNDNPNNTSFKKILKTADNINEVPLKGLYNPFEVLYHKGFGTTAYRDQWSVFDQIILSKSLIEKNYTSYQYYQSGIFNENFLITPTGKYKGYPFRSWNRSGFSNGFSDHFPVYVHLIKALN